jgi:2,3-bisphosphoglycerate-dependent phosphoglycerate mutase
MIERTSLNNMKQIYFIRHGQTDGNVRDIAHGKDMPLNAVGLEQADAVAARVANINVSKIYTSDFQRAQETAAAIAKTIHVPIEYSPAFGEFLEPSSLFGVSSSDERLKTYRSERNRNVENPTWKHEDGENFDMLFRRIKEAQQILSDEPNELVLVVSHTDFIRFFVGMILLELKHPTKEWVSLTRKLTVSNTGVSLLEVKDGMWRIIMLNDHAHFAE